MKNKLSLDINEILQCEHEGVMYYEEWEPIRGYEDLYEVSSFGRVKSLISGIILRQFLRGPLPNNKYLYVILYKKGVPKSYGVHQLVAMGFIGHILGNTLIVDHKDNISTNNFYLNLQSITRRENSSKDITNVSSKYTGVCWDKARNKWTAGIRVGDNSKRKNLGRFINEIDAHNAYQTEL